MTQLLDHLRQVPPALAYVVITALVFGESAVFLGFVLPGETAVLLGGALASSHRLSLPTLLVVVVVAAVVGDTVGYEVGRAFGPRLTETRLLRRHALRLQGAQEFLRRRGGSAVFIGRFTAFLRAVMPGLAGLSRMPYGRFLAYNATGALVWGAGVTLLGYFAGASYQRIAAYLGRGSAVLLALVALIALFWWRRSRRRARRSAV